MNDKPPDPGIMEEQARAFFEKFWLEKNRELEASIDFEVATRLEHYTKPLVEKIKDLGDRLEAANKEIHDLKTKKMTFGFGGVAQKTRIFEAGATLAAPQTITRARTPSPASSARPTASATPAPRPPPRPRRASITSYNEEIPIEEIRQSFRDCKREVRVSPITIEHIRVMYVALTNDETDYSDREIATGEKHAEARIEAARDYFLDELNMEEYQFRIEKVEYMANGSDTMIVTMREEKQVTRAFLRKAAVRNEALKVNNSWPGFSFHRRRAIFDLITEAKTKFPDYVYQARLGAQDLEIHEKAKGGYFHNIPLNMFLEMMDTRLEDIPGFGKFQEKSRGRSMNKRGPSSPEQQDRAAAQRAKTDDERDTEESTPVAETEGKSGVVSDNESISMTQGEKKDTEASKDGASPSGS